MLVAWPGAPSIAADLRAAADQLVVRLKSSGNLERNRQFNSFILGSNLRKGAQFAELPILREAGESDISSMCKRLQDAVIPVIETLEGRVLLSASVQGTTLMVDGNPSAPNKISVSYIRKIHSIRVVENRVGQNFPTAGLTGLQITGGTSKDVITVAAGVSLPTTINGMGGNDQITGNSENDTIITGQGSSIIHPGLGVNSIDLTLGSNRAYLTRKAQDTIIATKQDKVIGATKSTVIVAPSTPAGAPVSPPLPPVPPLPPAPSGPPELIPGAGFTGPTPQPQAIGSGFESDANAIARWDVVPDQTFSGAFEIGVVAFHANGIDHVSFSVNGGAWADVGQMTLNPQTNVVEYTAELKASDFAADGQIEVRAIAYPKVGVPRVLDSLFLNSDGGGTLPSAVRYVSPNGSDTNDGLTQQTPMKDPASAIHSAAINGRADGVTIYLMAGTTIWSSATYPSNLDTNPKQWVVITNAPGTTRDQVHLQGAGGGNAANGGSLNLIHLKNITIDAVTGNSVIFMSSPGQSVWFDGCYVDGTLAGGRYSAGAATPFADSGNGYATDTEVYNVQEGPEVALVRNCTVTMIEEDAFSGSPCVINSTESDVDPGTSGAHPDFNMQLASSSNVIYYGCSTPNPTQQINAQGLTWSSGVNNNDTHMDTAVVNCNISTGGGVEGVLVLDGTVTNMLFQNCTFRGVTRSSPDPAHGGDYTATDLFFNGCIFEDATTGNVTSNPFIEDAVFN